jgi:hypothetical protein
MLKSNSDFANEIIDLILELSADAQIERRSVAVDSPEFHSLTGAIVAYGKVLALLIALQRREEFIVIINEPALSGYASEQVN